MTTNPDNRGNANSRPTAPPDKQRKPLSHRDAEAASPDDYSVCGEEDPGSALESLVDNDKK